MREILGTWVKKKASQRSVASHGVQYSRQLFHYRSLTSTSKNWIAWRQWVMTTNARLPIKTDLMWMKQVISCFFSRLTFISIYAYQSHASSAALVVQFPTAGISRAAATVWVHLHM